MTPAEAEQRQAVADLEALAAAGFAASYAEVAGQPVEDVRDALIEVLPAIFAEYGDQAASIAADWFEEEREAAEAPGRFEPVLARVPDSARWEALARWGVDPLTGEVPDEDAAVRRLSGGLTGSVADQHRLTIVESSIADPQARGWRRVTRAGACGFCRVLADRGGVYTEATVTFKAHDKAQGGDCRCVASPAWDPGREVSTIPFRASLRNRSEAAKKADNARMYAYIRAQGYDEPST